MGCRAGRPGSSRKSMMPASPIRITGEHVPLGRSFTDIERWNDTFARDHDIDDYYARSGPLIRWVERQRLAHIRRMLDVRPGDRILEVGCGGGHVLRMFLGYELVGTDVSGEMIRKARKNLQGFRIELFKGELDQLNLPAGSFDRIICTEVLEHVVDPDRLLAQMGPGGAPQVHTESP